MPDGRRHIAVVGAGIVGVSTACMLAEKGFSVTLIDPEDPGKGGASRENAAQVFPSLIHPLPSPSVLRGALRLLADPLGPLFIPAAYFIPLLPWLVQFALASTPSRFKRGVAALTDLNRHSYSCFESLLKRAGQMRMLSMTGAIQLYESDKTLRQGMRFWEKVSFSHTGGAEYLTERVLRDMVPCVGRMIKGGVLIPNTGVLSDPLEVVITLADYARRLGVCLVKDKVVQALPEGRAIHLLCIGQEMRDFDGVVLAAGVWSRELTKELLEPQRIEAERGYNLTIRTTKPAIRHALVFAERGVVATQLSSGLRFGGWDELGGIKRAPNPRLFVKMEALACELLPGFNWNKGRRWMGLRPSLPDGLPTIGQSRKHTGIYYAFGHGHLGMTQGPITGLAIANLIAGEEPPFDLTPFAVR